MKNTNLVIGKIDSGKTTGIMFKEVKKAVEKNENLVILDNKEEYFKTFKDMLDDNQYTTLVFNLNDSSKSNSFNPLLLPYQYYKNKNKDKAIDLINQLGLEILKSDKTNVDPFWENSAASYFTALTLILFKEGKEQEINLGSIQYLVSLSDRKTSDTDMIKDYFKNLDVLDSIYITGSPIIYAPSETKGSILSVMKQKLNLYCMKEQLLNNLLSNEIDVSNLKNKTAIFIIGKDKLNGLSNILINQIFIALNTKKFTFLLDNFDDMPVLLELNNMLEKKIKLFVVIRNKDQLKDKYGKYIDTKFENIIENYNVDSFIQLGNNMNYPTAKINKASYFNLEERINKRS